MASPDPPPGLAFRWLMIPLAALQLCPTTTESEVGAQMRQMLAVD